MDSRQLIDAQFNRAVEIVQSLPKTGPIQTGYEEKLTMYSLYKQATVGNVTSPRPGIFDMLGRAKWDAWAKHRDLDQYEAKWLYVDALLKALSKYSDKTVAKELVDELHSFGGHSENLVSSYTLTRAGSRSSSSSSSTTSEDNAPIPPSYGLHDFQHPSSHQHISTVALSESSDDGEAGDETRDLPAMREVPQQQRPPSSISFSSRYKTPLMGSFALSSPPPRRTSVPPMQPLPNFETPSAFADPNTVTSVATSSTYTSSVPYAAPSSSRDLAPRIQSALTSRHSTTSLAHLRPPSRAISVSLEHAMENMQAHLAALTERIDTLESSLETHTHSQAQNSTSLSSHSSGRGSPAGSRSVSQVSEWDVDDMGLWTLVLKPFLRHFSSLQRLLLFFLRSRQDRSPALIVVRRLCLDISFVMVVLGLLRTVWIKSDTRRREVGVALRILWGAVTGRRRILGGKHLNLRL
ncbi:ACBP-domain-containing protein [Boletus edulis]|uniref:Acyl CoA binding protein-domain-containing protein n=1 Tax=Boletus edulis BED1 TaxID=1328754 RepID=A0AAD4C5T9_BOLED|nr:ACBP-domain-containing protein [Boletus edulis]KAF8450330.1 acyl CoA binding protein-domain-containing protein [Boletus edulis BED1]